jgi:hypothetical protein
LRPFLHSSRHHCLLHLMVEQVSIRIYNGMDLGGDFNDWAICLRGFRKSIDGASAL